MNSLTALTKSLFEREKKPFLSMLSMVLRKNKTMDLMEKYLSRLKLEVGEQESKVNNNEVINILQVEEPVYTYEEVKKLEGVSVEGLAAIQKIKKAFSGSSVMDVSKKS